MFEPNVKEFIEFQAGFLVQAVLCASILLWGLFSHFS